MGQYYMVVNIDKRQYLHPHKFNEGLKLMEFGCGSCGTMTGLAVLLADGNGRGGGDLLLDDDCPEELANLVGSWAGDRIVIAGDYADGLKFLPENATTKEIHKVAKEHLSEGYQDPERVNLYMYASEFFEDISKKVFRLINYDKYVKVANKF